MKKLGLISVLFILCMMLLQGCSSSSHNASQALPDKEQPSSEGNNTDKEQTNQTDTTNEKLLYENSEYGFTFSLPKSWTGYQIVKANWEGVFIDQQENKIVGPMLSIRHPKWTEKTPRQDIPIMIFTKEQWGWIESEKFSVSAAPIPPKKLAQNNQYVFALPPRYNYAFPEGFEEVEAILETNPLHPKNLN